MRILHVLAEIDPGGAERIVVQLAVDGRSRGDRVAVAATPGGWQPRIEAAGAGFWPVPLAERGARATVAAVAAVARCLREFRPSIVHSHNVRATAAARAALLVTRAATPQVATVHGLDPHDYRWGSRLLRLSGSRIVACSPSVHQALVSAGLPGRQVQVIVNGAALEPADAARQDRLRDQLGLGAEPLVVGIGRLDPVKNWALLIAAARHLEEAQVVVAGDGPLRQILQAQSRRAGGRVRFVGLIDDVAALLGLAACVVSTSDREGLSMALLETLASGKPTVVTAVDGLAELLPPDAAILVSRGDPDALAAAIRRVLGDPALAVALGQGARRAASQWTSAAMADGYHQLYQRLCAERSQR